MRAVPERVLPCTVRADASGDDFITAVTLDERSVVVTLQEG